MVHPALKQTWIVSGILLNQGCFGMLMTYPYCLLPALQEPDSPIKTDLESASWLASSVVITNALGMLLSSYLMEVIGRRNAFAVMVVPGIVGWILVYFATNITTLMIGRIVGGLWASTVFVLGSTVVGEYTTPRYRGLFLGAKTAAACYGNMCIHIMSYHFDWRTVALINIVPLIIVFCNICTWPESPSWLAAKGRYEKSEQEFYWLRGRDDKSVQEFEELIRTQRELLFNANRKLTFSDKTMLLLRKFKEKDFITPILIMFFSCALLEACGRHTFPAFAYDIISKIMGHSVTEQSNKFIFTIGLDIVTTISASMSCILTKVLGRRTLIFFSGISSLITLIIMCVYFSLLSNEMISRCSWIPLSLLVIYYSLANFGCTTIPVTLIAEIMPLRHRATGLAISGLLVNIPLLIVMKTTPIMLENIDLLGTFTVYGMFMVVTLTYLYFTLPETRNRTLQEVEEYFNNGSYLEQEMTVVRKEEEKQVMLKTVE